MKHLLLVGAFGAAGAICRYLTGIFCEKFVSSSFAVGTLAVNVVGCFLLGVVLTLVSQPALRLPDGTYHALGIGFLGALTTFSTFGLETLLHVERGEWWLAACNLLGNLILGLLAAAGGLAVGRSFVGA